MTVEKIVRLFWDVVSWLGEMIVWLRVPLLLAGVAAMAGWFGPPGWGWLFGSMAVAAFFIVSPGLRTAVWYARVPTTFAIIGVLALTVPEQVRYLVGGTQGLGQSVMLAFAVAATGMGCWFWGRWSLNLAEAGGTGPDEIPHDAWIALPRVLALAPAVAGLTAVFNAWDSLGDTEKFLLPVLLLAVGAGLVVLAFFRRSLVVGIRGIDAAERAFWKNWFLHDADVARRGPQADVPQGWLCLAIRCLPFHPATLLLPVALGFAASLMVLWWGGPVVSLTQWMGAAPTALFGMAWLLTLLAPVAGFMAARRWPALLLLLLWVGGATVANENNFVRTPEPAPMYRPTLAEAARSWLEKCAEEGPNIRVVLVAAAGGASRAALWGAAVLDRMERGVDGPGIDPAKHLFAVSGISGGALGMASYVATLDQAGAGCRGDAATKIDRDTRLNKLSEGLGRDFLSPALAGLFFGDGFWRALGPVSAVLRQLDVTPVERTYWLETAWERGVTLGGAGQPLTKPISKQTFPNNKLPPRLPLLFTGGTHQKTGRLVVTAPVVASEEAENSVSAVPGAIDATHVMASDPWFSVAASNSARFPVVTAPGLLRERKDPKDPGKPDEFGQVVDGGYNDNLGTTAIMAAANALIAEHRKLADSENPKLKGSRLHLFVVQVWSDPDRVVPDPAKENGPYTPTVPRCGVLLPSVALKQQVTPLDMALSPLGALVAVRGERSNSGTRPIVEAYCRFGWQDAGSRHFFAFTMGPDEQGVRPPLNWVQPEGSRKAMLHVDDKGRLDLEGFPGLGNQAQMKQMGDAWRRAATEVGSAER